MDEDGRKKMDNFLREMYGTFPNKVLFYICLHSHTKVYYVTQYINYVKEYKGLLIMSLLLKFCIINISIRIPSMSTVLTVRTKPGHCLRTNCPKAGGITPSK